MVNGPRQEAEGGLHNQRGRSISLQLSPAFLVIFDVL